MTDLWFNNPKILLKNLDEFFPDKSFNYNQKINSVVRFAIYFSILIIVLDYNVNYLYFALLIILISFYLGTNFKNNNQEYFNEKEIIAKGYNCRKPTSDNPFMNFRLGDLLEGSTKVNEMTEASLYDDVKDEMRSEFRKDLYTDTSDLWGKYISDRNFYSMPNTEIVNKQQEFAEWCYGGHGKCKETGNDCLKERDPTYNRGRITTEVDDNLL